jgi:glycosyltransferase involved in cell wall biosynthesis
MKILQVIPYFAPRWGGEVNVCYSLSKELNNLGHDVTIITTDFEYNPDYAQSLENVEVIPFRRVANRGLFLYSPEMKRWLRSNIPKYDIVHLHSFRSYQNNIVSKYATKFDIPYIVQPHGSLPRIVEKKGLKQLYDIVWGNKILQNAEGIIALTSMEAEQAVAMGVKENKIHIIANGVDLSLCGDITSKGKFRALYNIPSNTHVILYLGRLHPIKGVDLLIRAFAIVSKKRDDCILVVVGPDDGSLSELKALAEELQLCNKVLFTGPLYDEDKAAVYCDSDIYVLPSHYEAFPMTVLEAWAFKKPVIVTENCGIKDLVQGSGLVVHPDPYDLATALQEYLQQDSLCHSHGQNGYNKLHESLSIQATVQNVETLYREVIKSNGLGCFAVESTISRFAGH